MMVDGDINQQLKLAAHCGDLDEMRGLLKSGADPGHVDTDSPGGETALHLAADDNQLAAARLLIEHGADVNARAGEGPSDRAFWDFSGETPLHVASVSGGTELIKELLDAGADKSITTLEGSTAYDYAVYYEIGGEMEQYLYYKRAAMSDRQLTEFFFRKSNHYAPETRPALLRERRKLIASEIEFIRAAASPAIRRTRAGEVFTDRWAGFCDVERMAQLLARDPGLLQSVGPHLLNATIAMRGCAEATKFLLNHQVPVVIDLDRYNVLHEATYLACSENLRHVFEAGAADATGVAHEKPHTGWPDSTSLMYWAVKGGNVECAKLLIENGVGVHHELKIKGNGERGSTSLKEAVSDEYHPERGQEIAKLLIDNGAHYDVYSACGRNDTERLSELMKAQPGVAKAEDDFQMTPLHWAARAGAIECTEVLLCHGAVVNAQNSAQRTPLQMAADRDRPDMIRLLTASGADVNTQDKQGRTPLHRATYDGLVDAAEALLEVGADPSILNKKGKNAFEIARKGAKYLKNRPVN